MAWKAGSITLSPCLEPSSRSSSFRTQPAAANRAPFCINCRLFIIDRTCLVAGRLYFLGGLERPTKWVNNKPERHLRRGEEPGWDSSSLVRTLRDHKSSSRQCQFTVDAHDFSCAIKA